MKLICEHLEERCTPTTASLDFAGNIVVVGTAGRDTITVVSTNIAAVNVKDGATSIGVFDMTGGGRVIIHGLGDRDFIQGTGVVPMDVFGGDGNDTIYGTTGDDVLRGDGGNDLIDGRSGNDVLIGGYGKDTLVGGAGDDILVGGDTARSYDDLANDSAAWVASGDINDLLPLFATVDDPNNLDNVDRLTGGSGKDAFIYRTVGFPDLTSDINLLQGDDFITF